MMCSTRACACLCLCLSVAGMLVTAAAPLAAQTFGYDDRRPNESPQNFAIELRVGPWLPDIDAEFADRGGATPFRDIFGVTPEGSRERVLVPRWLFGAEFDWQIVRIGPVMSLGVGASLAYTNISANAPFTSSTLNPDPSNWSRSTESTSLSVIPGRLFAVARFDGLARHVRWVPIVPYVKFGPEYFLWWVTNGRGIACDPCSASGTTARRDAIGGSFGLHLAGGLALSLEVFEPQVQRQWDALNGVNHSYFFIELGTDFMIPLGRPQLDMSTTTWTGGIAIEF